MGMRRSRSAEQTARALLSSAVRYDTWECNTAAEGATDGVLTLQVNWDPLPSEPPFQDVVALRMTLFDVATSHFVGATYDVPRGDEREPVLFQGRPNDVVLAVEILIPAPLPDAVLRRQALFWGYVELSAMASSTSVKLYRGSAHVLTLGRKAWPASEGEEHTITFSAVIIEDDTTRQLLTRLVPTGVMVPRSFVDDCPQASTDIFRCVLQNIYIVPTADDDEWRDSSAEWRIAVVAHNGYRQLGQGAEVSLVFRDGSKPSNVSEFSDSLSLSLSSLPVKSEQIELKEQLLHSATPLEIDGLPVHSATSLVLAIRRKREIDDDFRVLGFCVFPLCVMPMKDCDVRIENLPTLQGPFSCRDQRMLMLEPTSPYGKLPVVVTLVVGYYDTGVVDTVADVSRPGVRGEGRLGRRRGRLGDEGDGVSAAEGEGKTTLLSITEGAKLIPTPFDMRRRQMEILSTADALAPVAAADKRHSAASFPLLDYADDGGAVGAVLEGRSTDVFKMLCNIMEETRRLRQMQEQASRQHRQRAVEAKRVSESGKQLDDATDSITVLNFTPTAVSISWETRRKLEEGLQPILHPLHAVPIDEHTSASCTNAGSMYGIRFEGLTVDESIPIPKDICFMFSFGSLPFQTIGPIRAVALDKSLHVSTFKLYEGKQRGGMIWYEPFEVANNPFLHKHKQRDNAILYVHIYNALTMFYVCSANVRLSEFRRPYNAESARIPKDLVVYRDLSFTEIQVPSKVLPVVRDAGSLHVTLFCICTGQPLPKQSENRVVEPLKVSRVVVARKLPHTNLMEAKHHPQQEATRQGLMTTANDAASEQQAVHSGPETGGVTGVPYPGAQPLVGSTTGLKQHGPTAGVDFSTASSVPDNDMHWRRAQYIKQLYANGIQSSKVHLGARPQDADCEFKLRYLEKQRDELKSKKIGEALMERLTVHHYISVASFRPEQVSVTFQNPFAQGLQFTVEVDPAATDALDVLSCPTVHLGPREHADILFVVRLNQQRNTYAMDSRSASVDVEGEQVNLRAFVYTPTHEAVRIIDVHANVGPPCVDRRYEVYGPSGSRVTKKIFSRFFSSSAFSVSSERDKLLSTMRDACLHVSIASDETTVEPNVVLDPITQSSVTVWEEVTIHTTIPRDCNEQRVEYLTLFEDEKLSKALETWELSIFASQTVTTRELMFGQTTAVALPSEGVEAIYCSDPRMRVEQREGLYMMHLRPHEVGTQHLLLHSLTSNHLAKTLVTVPTVYPTPTYTQTIELSVEEANAPILRRLHFVNVCLSEDIFTVHHNYKYQLHVQPKTFVLAPQDTQVITLHMSMLRLPEGQLEGRWPMWIFINNSADKTVESYLLHVVLRARHVLD
ncbi:hypothetical protein, conserved [Trypanosoma brucei brucei TREU927]|uniref:Nephrocystin-4 n=1 Tax=Trypanosoma brucei brucei (strain 927/4 GUTat10.1) TaxID=185431 RepID=Q57ZA4_TRYB2|nr:hypothetical protein, conserved [Trypanosoma brucei brucei TREU927]AAX80238.1 hypothetical protein, conserved [Trypanosoma brucei]AAZ10242.1 hypothetical protein, conserved [Trypanosoma brucei brucei TREU927]